jgi:hypothetical protein
MLESEPMKIIRTGMRCLVAAFLMTASAHAASIVYIFTGVDNSGMSPEVETFELIVPDFIDPPAGGVGVDFTCDQLNLSTDCSSPGVIFSEQNGAFSAQLQFDAPVVGSIFAFPTGAFTTIGNYGSQPGGTNMGVLSVQESPEPASFALALGAGLLYFVIRLSTRAVRVGQR